MSRRLRIGVDLAKRLAAGKARVGPRFTSLPHIDTGFVGDVVDYTIGTIEVGTIKATIYEDGEVFLDDIDVDGVINIQPQHAGARFYIESIATNSYGNITREVSDDMFVDSAPTVPIPIITVLEETDISVEFSVVLGDVVGNIVSSEVTIFDGTNSYELEDGSVVVPKRATEGVLTVIREVMGVGGDPVTVSAMEDIPAVEAVDIEPPIITVVGETAGTITFHVELGESVGGPITSQTLEASDGTTDYDIVDEEVTVTKQGVAGTLTVTQTATGVTGSQDTEQSTANIPASSVEVWIMSTGSWNDDGVWDDSDVWKDAA